MTLNVSAMLDALQTWSWAIDGWMVVVGVLCAVACSLLGNFLVLRKMSMMGDAISHAVLPGLAASFLVWVWLQQAPWVAEHLPALQRFALSMDARASIVMFLGAAVIGVLTAVFTEWVRMPAGWMRGRRWGWCLPRCLHLGW